MARTERICQAVLALCVGVFCMVDAALGDPLFNPAVTYSVGDQPNSVAVGDLDGDNNLDLVVANEGDNEVSVLLGNGDGTFQGAVQYAGGTRCTSVAVGDLDGDNNLDLAVANEGSANVSVLIGYGDGTFEPAVNYSSGPTPSSVAVGDLDGDNALDLVVANWNGHNVSVLLGDGDGTFQGAVNYSVGDNPSSLAIGDLDADNDLDVAVANQYSYDVSVLLGNGDGTFAPAANYALGDSSYPSSVAIGDLDEDTVPDLAVAKEITNNVAILLGNGNGTFQAGVDYPAGTSPFSVVIGDLDLLYRHLDVAVAAYTTQGRVWVLLGDGDGTLQAPTDYVAGGKASSVAMGDLDRDAVPDLVVANYNSDTVSVFINMKEACNDTDGDGYGAPANPLCGFPEEDCDNGNRDIYPGAPEICNGIDDDCEAATADGADEPWLGADCDGPDSDDCLEGTYSCQAGSAICSDNTSDDIEVCNGIDDDCKATTADGADEPWLGDPCDGPDSDECLEGNFSCLAGSQFCSVDNPDDDIEVCDGLDNDCNTEIPLEETDDDGDQYVECTQWVGTDPGILGDNDCNDADPEMSPGIFENAGAGNCGDGKDNDCDGYVDSADCDCSYTGCANAEAATYGSSSLTGSGTLNELILLFIPVGAVLLLKTLRRKG
jgi:hypothetical protein